MAPLTHHEPSPPLLRDPPLPPGYVDPVEGSIALRDLFAVDPGSQPSRVEPSVTGRPLPKTLSALASKVSSQK